MQCKIDSSEGLFGHGIDKYNTTLQYRKEVFSCIAS